MSEPSTLSTMTMCLIPFHSDFINDEKSPSNHAVIKAITNQQPTSSITNPMETTSSSRDPTRINPSSDKATQTDFSNDEEKLKNNTTDDPCKKESTKVSPIESTQSSKENEQSSSNGTTKQTEEPKISRSPIDSQGNAKRAEESKAMGTPRSSHRSSKDVVEPKVMLTPSGGSTKRAENEDFFALCAPCCIHETIKGTEEPKTPSSSHRSTNQAEQPQAMRPPSNSQGSSKQTDEPNAPSSSHRSTNQIEKEVIVILCGPCPNGTTDEPTPPSSSHRSTKQAEEPDVPSSSHGNTKQPEDPQAMHPPSGSQGSTKRTEEPNVPTSSHRSTKQTEVVIMCESCSSNGTEEPKVPSSSHRSTKQVEETPRNSHNFTKDSPRPNTTYDSQKTQGTQTENLLRPNPCCEQCGPDDTKVNITKQSDKDSSMASTKLAPNSSHRSPKQEEQEVLLKSHDMSTPSTSHQSTKGASKNSMKPKVGGDSMKPNTKFAHETNKGEDSTKPNPDPGCCDEASKREKQKKTVSLNPKCSCPSTSLGTTDGDRSEKMGKEPSTTCGTCHPDEEEGNKGKGAQRAPKITAKISVKIQTVEDDSTGDQDDQISLGFEMSPRTFLGPSLDETIILFLESMDYFDRFYRYVMERLESLRNRYNLDRQSISSMTYDG